MLLTFGASLQLKPIPANQVRTSHFTCVHDGAAVYHVLNSVMTLAAQSYASLVGKRMVDLPSFVALSLALSLACPALP